MERFSRKLQKIHESYFVSLPKTWVKTLHLNKNSTIEMVMNSDGTLKLAPKLERLPKIRKTPSN